MHVKYDGSGGNIFNLRAAFTFVPLSLEGTHLAEELLEMDDPMLLAVELGQNCDKFRLPEGAHHQIGVGRVGQRDGRDGDSVKARHVVGAPAHRLVPFHVGPIVSAD